MASGVSELALSKLLKTAGDKKKNGNESRADEVRQLCEATLATLSQAKALAPGAATSEVTTEIAAAVFVPFIVALETKSTPLVEDSLDGINELIAHGQLRDCADPRDASKKLVEVLVGAVCGCGCMHDEKVQMYVVRVLQTAILSERNYIHGASLLQSVRTCFNVHLGSASLANQTAAKAALSRIINAMMNRMEGLPLGNTTNNNTKSPCIAPSDLENGRTHSSSTGTSTMPATPPGITPTATGAPTPHLPNSKGAEQESICSPPASVRKTSVVEEDDVYEVFFTG
jgi:hypothetical protein